MRETSDSDGPTEDTVLLVVIRRRLVVANRLFVSNRLLVGDCWLVRVDNAVRRPVPKEQHVLEADRADVLAWSGVICNLMNKTAFIVLKKLVQF